jgi:hypothetical protein
MEMEHAAWLRHHWGNKPCDHPQLEEEVHHGNPTGDYACTTCGESDWGSDWNIKRQPRTEDEARDNNG